MRLHHVQLAMPPGREDLARRFYRDALGLTEVDKPVALAGRGGCWFRAFDGDQVTAEIHFGVEQTVTPATKAHPALAVDTVVGLESLAGRIGTHGFEVDWSERHTFAGYERLHSRDGFGNRVEVLAPADPSGRCLA